MSARDAPHPSLLFFFIIIIIKLYDCVHYRSEGRREAARRGENGHVEVSERTQALTLPVWWREWPVGGLTLSVLFLLLQAERRVQDALRWPTPGRPGSSVQKEFGKSGCVLLAPS